VKACNAGGRGSRACVDLLNEVRLYIHTHTHN